MQPRGQQLRQRREESLTQSDRQRLGAAAERAVTEYLTARGYEIVARNLTLGRLELDVVARHERLVVVVEVRARSPSAWTTGLSSIDTKKRGRVRRAGERLWRHRYRNDTSVDRMRFDAASVTFDDGVPVVEYVVAAF